MRMFNPPHPGEVLREDVLPHLGLTVTDSAAALGVTRAALSRVLNGQAAISTEMALRLEKWLGVESGGSADAWIAQQAAYELWRARKEIAPKIARIKRARSAANARGTEHAAAKAAKH
jgi:addiction module HigA family antidote